MRLRGYRTFLVNGAAALAAVVTLIADTDIPPGASLAVIGVAVLNAYMRTITTTPAGKPE